MSWYRRSDRGRPMHVGEPVLLCVLAAVCLYLGLTREAPLALLSGIVLAFVAVLSVYGWSTGGPMEE